MLYEHSNHSVNRNMPTGKMQDIASHLEARLKFLSRFTQRVIYQDTVYSIKIKKDPSLITDGQLGRASLIKNILKNHPLDHVEESLQILDTAKNPQAFVNSLKTGEEKSKQFNEVARDFSVKYTRGSMNIFRWILLNHHRRSQEADGLPILYKKAEFDLTNQNNQVLLYRNLMREMPNAFAFRLAMSYSNHRRYNEIQFDHMINLVAWNYRSVMEKDSLDSENMKKIIDSREVNGILGIVCKFTLFLFTNGVEIHPLEYLTKFSYKGLYTLKPAILRDDGFKAFLDENFDAKDLFKALRHGLIMNPWQMMGDFYQAYQGNDKNVWRWNFINDVDEIIDRFQLTVLANNDKEIKSRRKE